MKALFWRHTKLEFAFRRVDVQPREKQRKRATLVPETRHYEDEMSQQLAMEQDITLISAKCSRDIPVRCDKIHTKKNENV